MGRKGKPIKFGEPMSRYRTRKAKRDLASVALSEEAKRKRKKK